MTQQGGIHTAILQLEQKNWHKSGWLFALPQILNGISADLTGRITNPSAGRCRKPEDSLSGNLLISKYQRNVAKENGQQSIFDYDFLIEMIFKD